MTTIFESILNLDFICKNEFKRTNRIIGKIFKNCLFFPQKKLFIYIFKKEQLFYGNIFKVVLIHFMFISGEKVLVLFHYLYIIHLVKTFYIDTLLLKDVQK